MIRHGAEEFTAPRPAEIARRSCPDQGLVQKVPARTCRNYVLPIVGAVSEKQEDG